MEIHLIEIVCLHFVLICVQNETGSIDAEFTQFQDMRWTEARENKVRVGIDERSRGLVPSRVIGCKDGFLLDGWRDPKLELWNSSTVLRVTGLDLTEILL